MRTYELLFILSRALLGVDILEHHLEDTPASIEQGFQPVYNAFLIKGGYEPIYLCADEGVQYVAI